MVGLFYATDIVFYGAGFTANMSMPFYLGIGAGAPFHHALHAIVYRFKYAIGNS